MQSKDQLVRMEFIPNSEADSENNPNIKLNKQLLSFCVNKSGGTEKRSTSLTLEERRTVAYHESGHALVGW